MRATKQTLVVEGFQITAADDTARVISTAPRDMRLTPADADCGTTMGIDYLKDNRTAATVAYGAVISDGRVLVKATIAAKYLPSNNSQSITMDCVSKGVLEAALLNKIQAAM